MLSLNHGHDSTKHHVDRCRCEGRCDDEEDYVDDVDGDGPAAGAGAFFDGVSYPKGVADYEC